MERKKKNSKLGFVAGFLYGGSTCLVTLPRKEEAPARREGRHGVELAGMRTGEDEDDPLLSFFFKTKGYVWAGKWASGGLLGWLLLGCSDLPGKPTISLIFFPVFISCFPFLFCNSNLNLLFCRCLTIDIKI
jgi:hypothetical protein